MISIRPGQKVHSMGRLRISQPMGAPGNGLLNNLIAYWPGNEASGNALDLHTNALHLTDVNTVTNAVGKVYATARQYTSANNEYHGRLGDDALLSLGADSDITLACWVNPDSVGNTTRFIANKRNAGLTAGYQIAYLGTDFGGTNRFGFGVGSGAGIGQVSATTIGLPVAGTWYFIIAWHDATADTVNIQVNGGAVDSAAWAGGTADDAEKFRIGATSWSGALFYNGRIGPTAFWKSVAGAGGALSAAQRASLYNAGAGLPYASFTT